MAMSRAMRLSPRARRWLTRGLCAAAVCLLAFVAYEWFYSARIQEAVDGLLSDDADTRGATLRSLRPAGTQEAIGRLVGILYSPGSEHDRAIRALSEIGKPAKEPLIAVLRVPWFPKWLDRVPTAVKRTYIKRLIDRREAVFRAKLGAFQVLGRIGDTGTIRDIAECGGSVECEGLCDWALGLPKSKRWAQFEGEAETAIVRMGEPAVTWMLQDSVKCGFIPSFYERSLVTLGRQGYIDPIVGVSGNNTRLSRDARCVLVDIGDRRAVAPLVELLRQPGNGANYDIATCLYWLGGAEAEQALREFDERNKDEIEAGLHDLGSIARRIESTNDPVAIEHEKDLCWFLLQRHGTVEMAEEMMRRHMVVQGPQRKKEPGGDSNTGNRS